MLLDWLLAGFESPLYPKQIGPFRCWVQGGWVCVHSRTLWVSQQTFLWGWEFLLLPPQPPWVFSFRGLRLYFPRAGTLSCVVCFTTPPFLPSYLCANVGPRGLPAAACLPRSTILPLTGSTSCTGRLSPPLLLVWMNVSSLSPWLSDFHTVLFSVSSGCFLFLNCCCPSFGCAKRHSVSTYASILAGSPHLFLILIGISVY